MSEKEINIAIAEACGEDNDSIYRDLIPNYLNDLNAMHDAEQVLTDDQWPIYRDEIRLVVLGPIRMVSDWCKSDIHATATQRAKAFLKTIDKWKE